MLLFVSIICTPPEKKVVAAHEPGVCADIGPWLRQCTPPSLVVLKGALFQDGRGRPGSAKRILCNLNTEIAV